MPISYKFRYLINDWQQHAIEELNGKFRQQLRATDDVLMEFADKAESVNIQNHFFEAQREIWLKMEDMSLDFHDLLVKYLGKFPNASNEEKQQLGGETLSLVNVDLYERNLALHTLAERAERKNYQLLYVLAQRLSVVNEGQPVKIPNIPASPRQMSEVFARCVDRLSIENDALLVLYTLYDKYVLSGLGELHEELNEKLKTAGILPNLKYKAKINPESATSKEETEKVGEPEKAQTTEELGEETLSRIHELLMAKRAIQHKKKPLPPGVQAATTQEVVNATNNIIHREDTSFPEQVQLGKIVSRESVNAEVLSGVQQAMQDQRAALKETIGNDRLLDEQENIIDLVGMLFERMLDDERIPDITKALLGHLHTPYIKIGLLNPKLFSSKDHPARLFLDQTVEAAALWMNEADLDEGVYPFLKDMVFRIVRLRHQKNSDFEEFSRLLKDEIIRLEEKFTILERHSRESEQGQELMSRAKSMAKSAAEATFDGQTVPDYCAYFIEQVWIDYLTLLRLREGVDTDSPAWEEALDLGRYLLGTSQEVLARTAQQPQLDTLSEQLWAQVGGLLPHKSKEIERFVKALEEQPKEQITLDLHHKGTKVKPKINPKMMKTYNRLRALPENTVFEFDLRTSKSYRTRLSWYNHFSDRFLFVNNRGKKTSLLDIAELAEGLLSGDIAYYEDIKTSFWDRAMTAIKTILERAPQTTS
ncbi:DUF1631 family protein [Thiolapillus sp.]